MALLAALTVFWFTWNPKPHWSRSLFIEHCFTVYWLTAFCLSFPAFCILPSGYWSKITVYWLLTTGP